MSSGSSDRKDKCTIMRCSGKAIYAYWMPDLGHFSEVRSPEHDQLDDGDLCPYVCESCRDRMANSPHWDRDRFIRPEEKLVADGGSVPCPSCDRDDFKNEHGMNIHHATVHGESLTRETTECDHCGESYEVPPGTMGQFCSTDCRDASMRSGSLVECDHCEKEFHAADWELDKGRRFCSQSCYGASKLDRDDSRCEGCGRDYSAYNSAGIRYCSTACMMEARTSQPRPSDLDGLLWVLYVYEGHSPRATWLRANCVRPPDAEWVTKDEVTDRLRNNDWMNGEGGGRAKYAHLSAADVGLDDDPTPEGDETWVKYYDGEEKHAD